MSRQRLQLQGSAKARKRRDPEKVRDFVEGRASLRDALAIKNEQVSGLREQGRALFEAGRHRRALDVYAGVLSLGTIEPEDLLVMGRCYRGLGNRRAATLCEAQAQEMLEELDRAVRRQADRARP